MRTQVQSIPRTLASDSGSTPGIEAFADDDSIEFDDVLVVGADDPSGSLRLSEQRSGPEPVEAAGERPTPTPRPMTPEPVPELTEATDEEVQDCIRAAETDSQSPQFTGLFRAFPFVTR